MKIAIRLAVLTTFLMAIAHVAAAQEPPVHSFQELQVKPQDTPETLASTPVVTSTRGEEPGGPEGVIVPGRATSQPSRVIGVRVRITTASTVELAGLVRLEGRTITGRVLSSDDDTVTTTSGVGQPNVTVPRPHRKVVGVVADLQPQALTMTREHGSALTVPRAAIAKLERQVGTRSRKRGAALGFLIGGGAGAGIGFLIGSSCHSTAFLGCFMEPAVSTFGGMILGGAAGTVTGALTAPRERWEEVPRHWLDGQRVTP